MPPGAWAAALWLLACLARDSSEALTTFGKTQTVPPTPAKPTPPPGRECMKEADCAGIQDTSCVRHLDGRMRCLCGDNTSPFNGRCPNTLKGLKHSCGTSDDCAEGMICAMPNATRPNPTGKMKMCQCNAEEGFVDRDTYCSDGITHKSIYSMIILAAVGTTLLRNVF